MSVKVNKKDKYESEILKVIKKNSIFNICDIFAFYSGCTRPTFYVHHLDKSDSILKAIDDNKIKTKQTLKSKWLKSNNATLQIAFYKLICTDEERRLLSQSHLDITTDNQPIIWKETKNYGTDEKADKSS